MKKARALLAMVVLAWGAAAAWQAPAGAGEAPPEARQHLQRGNALFDAGKYEEARAEYEQAIAAAPDWYEGYYELGQTYWAMHDLAEAEKQMRLAVARSPECWLCLSGLGNILDDAGHGEEAIGYFHKAIALAPAAGKPRYNLAITEIRLNRVDDAIAELLTAEKVEPKYPSPYFLLGRIYFTQDKLYLAEDQYTQATKLETHGERYDDAKQLIDVSIVLDKDLKEDEGAVHLAYCMSRAAAMAPEEYHKRFPGAETYVDNLDEELYVFTSFAKILDELGQSGKKPDPAFTPLVEIYKAGYLAPYLLLTTKDGLAGDRKPFEAKNPGKIEEFKKWAQQNGIALEPPRLRCEVRWMARTW